MSDEIEMRAVRVAHSLSSIGFLRSESEGLRRDVATIIARAMEDVCAEAFERADRLAQDNTEIAHERGELRDERDRYREALDEIAHGDDQCRSKYGPGCDGVCKIAARRAMALEPK